LNADADVIVTNNLELIDGIVVTSSTNSLTLNSGSSVTLSGSPQDNSFVSGPLTRVVNSNALTNLTFPVGKDGIYRRVDLNIDQSNTNTTSYVAEVFNASGAGLYNKPSGIERISSVRYYNVSQSPATALDGAQLRIYYGVDDEVEDPPTLTVVKQNGVDWQDITGSAAGAPVGSILSGTFTSFSDFALGSTSLLNPLPIELLSFQGKLANGVVNLNWSTASEKNNDYFTVEKTTDFQQFDVVEVIPGSGNSSQKLDYTTEDKNPYPGVSYYRLKQTDFDGTTSYSRIISVENNHYSEPRVVLYPNPANQATYLLTSNFYEDNLQIKIYSNRGQLVKDVSLNKDEAAQFNNEINLNDLSSGLYMVEITSFNQAFFKKLVIK